MISLPILLVSFGCAMASKLTTVHEWTYLDYHWRSESEKQLAIATGLYNATNIILYDSEWCTADRRLFVTTPRIYHANPASLSTIFQEPGDKGSALLQPFPSPEWHVIGNCSGITNVMKIVIDKCDNMWMVDSGTIANKVICPAQILKFDARTDQLVMRYKIPEGVSKGGLLATNIARTEGANCEKITVIAADLRGSGYVIFDGTTSWRLESNNFKPDANYTSFKVDDRTVNVTWGAYGFFHIDKEFVDTELGIMWPFSGKHAYGLSMQDLLNSRRAQANLQWYKSKSEAPSPQTNSLVSKQGTYFMSYIGQQKLGCGWMGNPVTIENTEVLISETELPLIITSLKITTDNDGTEYLWLTMNNYMRFRAGITNSCKVNAGVYVVEIAKLTNGTRCHPKAHVLPCRSWETLGYTPLENRNDPNP